MDLKKLARRAVHRLGYDVRRLRRGTTTTRTSIAESYDLIRSLGFRPGTIIDVGVADGTYALYSAFPDAYVLLVEPLREFEPDLKIILGRYRGSYVLAAAGAASGQLTFHVHSGQLHGSSLYRDTTGAQADGVERTVPVVRLDDVIKERGLRGPYLIKVDVQGAELDVLDGAPQALAEAEAVVLEVSFFAFMRGAPQFYDIVAAMKQRGFVAYDIIPGLNRPLDNALGQVDIMFVKEAGMFRRSHAYG